jgi:hypothetical protein
MAMPIAILELAASLGERRAAHSMTVPGRGGVACGFGTGQGTGGDRTTVCQRLTALP